MHDDDMVVSDVVARALVDEQFTQYADLTLDRLTATGTVNVVFRLGDSLTARFPRRAGDPDEITTSLRQQSERMTEFAARSTVPAPTPVGIGEPGHGYPMPWSIQTWVPGSTASATSAQDSARLVTDLAELLTALRTTPTRGRSFAGGNRGGDLRAHDAWVEACLVESEELLDVDAVRGLWIRLRATPRDQPDGMCHGDLVPGNLLVEDGRLVGVIDSGGFGPADPALDLVVGWHVLGETPRQALRTALVCSDREWERGKAWALQQAVGAAWYYQQTNPAMHEMGMTTLRRLLASEKE